FLSPRPNESVEREQTEKTEAFPGQLRLRLGLRLRYETEDRSGQGALLDGQGGSLQAVKKSAYAEARIIAVETGEGWFDGSRCSGAARAGDIRKRTAGSKCGTADPRSRDTGRSSVRYGAVSERIGRNRSGGCGGARGGYSD